MNRNTEATLSTIAALWVLFSALLDPRISAGLAVVFLIAMSVYLWRSHPVPHPDIIAGSSSAHRSATSL